MTRPFLHRFLHRREGATSVEVALLTPLVFFSLLSGIDLGLYVWRWNQSVQAVRVIVRQATISDPVSSDLKTMTGLETGAAPGDPIAAYERRCALGSATCTGGDFDQAAADRLFYGPVGKICGDAASRSTAGLCDLAPRLQPENVWVTYRASGVDSAGVTGGARPLVTIETRGARSDVILLNHIVPNIFLTLPATEVTLLAEDLRSST